MKPVLQRRKLDGWTWISPLVRYPSPLWVMPGRGVEPLLHHQALDAFTASVAITATAIRNTEASTTIMDLSTDLRLTCTEVTATFNVQLDEHTQLIPTF